MERFIDHDWHYPGRNWIVVFSQEGHLVPKSALGLADSAREIGSLIALISLSLYHNMPTGTVVSEHGSLMTLKSLNLDTSHQDKRDCAVGNPIVDCIDRVITR
jgi:hypothetical protein